MKVLSQIVRLFIAFDRFKFESAEEPNTWQCNVDLQRFLIEKLENCCC